MWWRLTSLQNQRLLYISSSILGQLRTLVSCNDLLPFSHWRFNEVRHRFWLIRPGSQSVFSFIIKGVELSWGQDKLVRFFHTQTRTVMSRSGFLWWGVHLNLWKQLHNVICGSVWSFLKSGEMMMMPLGLDHHAWCWCHNYLCTIQSNNLYICTCYFYMESRKIEPRDIQMNKYMKNMSSGDIHIYYTSRFIQVLNWMSGETESLTMTMSPVRELARSVTEEWPSASGGWPLGLLAGLLPL